MEDKSFKFSAGRLTSKKEWWIISIIVLILIIAASGSSHGQPARQTPSVASGQSSDTTCNNVAMLKTTAKKVSYAELSKNPDSYKGTSVKFTGQILQILESNGQGVIRLSVTNLGYGTWSSDDVVYVTYTGHNDFVNGDVVTVYGVLQGSYTYTSQANYQITLPSMEACDVEKPNVSTAAANTNAAPIVAPVVTGTPTAPTTPSAPQAPKTWHVVTTFSGNDNRTNTDPFIVQGSQWRIVWSANADTANGFCQQYGCDFTAQIFDTANSQFNYIEKENVTSTASDTSNFYTPGTYYLTVDGTSMALWNMRVEDYY